MKENALALLKKTPFSYLGMTFSIAWVYVVFYTPALSPLSPVDLSVIQSYRICNLVASLCAFLLLILLQKRFKEISLVPAVQTVSAVLCAASTLVVAFVPAEEPLGFGIGLVACTIASACSTPIYIAWGHFYGQPFNRSSKILLPFASALSMLLCLICLFLFGIGLSLIAAFLPLLSLLFYRKAISDSARPEDEAAAEKQTREESIAAETAVEEETLGKFPWRIAFVLAAFWFIFTYLNAYTTWANTDSHEWLFGWGFILGLLGSLFVIYQFTDPRRHTTFSTVFKTAIPLLLTGVVILLLFPDTSTTIVHSICLLAMTIINIHILIFGAVFVRKHILSATTSFAGLRVFASAGEGAALILFSLMSPELSYVTLAVSLVFMIAGLLCILLAAMTDTNIDNFHDNRHIKYHSEIVRKIPAAAPPPGVSEGAASDEAVALLEKRVRAMEAFEHTCQEIAKTYELSARETEVMILVGRGRDLPYICERLFISKPTTNTHIRHIYEKIGIHSKQELIDMLERMDEERASQG